MLYFFFGIFCRCRRIRTGCFFHLSGYLDDGSLTGNGSRFQADPSRTDAFGQFGQGGLADGMADGEDDLFMDIVRQGADVVLDAFVVDDVAHNGYTLHIAAADGGVAVTSSDCPTQDCVHTGRISRAGQSIVCLPAQVAVQLVGAATPDAPDVIVG